MTNIVVVSQQNPNDPLNGCDHRIWNLLSQGRASVLCFGQKEYAENGQLLTKKYEWQNIESALLPKRIQSISHQDFFVRLFIQRNQDQISIIRKYVQNNLKNNQDTVLIGLGHEIGIILSVYFPYQFIFEANADSKSLYFERRFQYLGYDQFLKKLNSKYLSLVYRSVENYITRHSPLCIVPSEIDRQWILKGNPQANVFSIGNGTSWLEQPPINKIPKDSQYQSVIAFHGGMTWPANRTCALYLIKNIFPLIQSHYPSAKLRIAGGPIIGELASVDNINGVEICGFVENIRDWLAECDVYVMPMLEGSGIKTKLTEAMAAGLTVVTNSLGAEALPEEARQGVIITDGEENIANAVVYLLNNPEESLKLGKKARRMAEKYFRWEDLSQQLMTKLEEISQPINNV